MIVRATERHQRVVHIWNGQIGIIHGDKNMRGTKIYKCEKCGKEVGATANSIRITRRHKRKIVKIDTYHVKCWLEDMDAE